MPESAGTDRGEKIWRQSAETRYEKNSEIRDRLLWERMYGSYGVMKKGAVPQPGLLLFKTEREASQAK